MKIGANSNTQGSFGIPPAMKAAADEFAKKREEGEQNGTPESGIDDLPADFKDPQAEIDPNYDEGVEEGMAVKNPIQVLEDEFAIKLEDEDFHKIVFKGFLEKDVIALPPIRGTKPLIATFKTLNGDDYDLIDELLAEDVRDRRMTNDGFGTRRGMWMLAAGVTKIQGKPLCALEYSVLDGVKEFNVKATTRKKREVLAKLNGAVLTRMMRIHAQLTLAINAVIEDPTADYLKKP